MAADLFIHVRVPSLTEEMLEKHEDSYFYGGPNDNSKEIDEIFKLIHGDIDEDQSKHPPLEWVGEVSWLKAALLNDYDTFVPSLVGKVSELIGDKFKLVDDEFIEEIGKAFSLENKTGYTLAEKDSVINFLKKYKGREVFHISH